MKGESKLLKKYSKIERMTIITKTLVENPSKIYTLQYFSDFLNSAKSTLSEDVKMIEEIMKDTKSGTINSLPGAAGGIYYFPEKSNEQIEEVKNELCTILKDEKRIITGGYLYMNDIFYNPEILEKISKCIVNKYKTEEIDYIVTIETKGIPLAMTIARLINKPIIVVRKAARLTEGTTIQTNYITSSSKTIKTMALPIKSINRNSKVLFVDDFMKAGGTAKGIIDLMKEFDTEVVGIAVVMATKEPFEKVVKNYYSLITFEGIDEENKEIRIFPN